MQRAKRCPESPSFCWTMMLILVGLAGYAVGALSANFRVVAKLPLTTAARWEPVCHCVSAPVTATFAPTSFKMRTKCSPCPR